MAHYTIKQACGHTTDHQIVGPEKGRETQAARIRNSDCPACYRAKQAAVGAKLEAELDLDLKPLTGSAKQVAWANTIRAQKITLIKAFAEQHGVAGKPEFAAIMSKMAAIQPASWWIDMRDSSDVGIIQAMERKSS